MVTPKKVTAEETPIKELDTGNAIKTDLLHYYKYKGVLWSSYYAGITGSRVRPISKERALKLAERRGVPYTKDGVIHQF